MSNTTTAPVAYTALQIAEFASHEDVVQVYEITITEGDVTGDFIAYHGEKEATATIKGAGGQKVYRSKTLGGLVRAVAKDA